MTPVRLLLSLLDEAFDRKAWHGTTLLGSVRGLSAADAARRPAPGRHNIWEIVVHAAYWKYTVRRRLTGGKPRGFSLDGSNWFARPGQDREVRSGARRRGSETDERAFRADVRLLIAEHRALREVVAQMSEGALDERAGTNTKAYLIRSIAAHDLYHAGQIQLLKRLVT